MFGKNKTKANVDNAQMYNGMDSATLEENANRYTLKCLIITYFFMAFVWLLNILRIFIVDSSLMNQGFFAMSVLILGLFIICKINGYSRHWIKYLIITFAVIMTSILGVMLTYHTILACVLPVIYAVQYSNKRFVFFAYILEVVGMFVSVMGGYFFGLCDANMLVLTTKPMSAYVDLATNTANFGTINPNPWISIPLFYVFPRALLLLAIIPVMTHVSEGIAKRELREMHLQRLSEVDDMTQLYNKNKYRTMLKDYYPTVSHVGVVFWDVNGLKETNDTLGHEVGDKLISAIADSIRGFIDDNCRIYRVGGDEFVLIYDNASDKQMKDILYEWNKTIEERNFNSDIKLSAAVGYAIGEGANIGKTIKKADDNMYHNKVESKKQRKN